MNREEKKIVPQLRFPEFESDGDWDEKRLDEVAKVVTGSTPKTADLENYGGDKLFVSPADISDGRYIDKTIKTLSEKGFSQSRVIPKNSILFVCIGSTIGKLAQNKIECTTNQQINSIIPFKSTSNDFIYSLLEKNAAYIASLAAQQAVPLINKSDFSAVRFYYPPNPKEQQKIAACLSSLDEVITAETEKLDLLQDHKKGLLQQLFPTEGETQPKFRFPEFKDDGDWEQDELGRSLKAESSQIAKSRLNFIDEGFSLFGADGFNGFIDSYSQEKHYIAIVKDGSGVGNLYYCEGKSSVLGTLNYLLSKNEEKYDTKWLYYLLNTISFKPFIKGANIPHIYFKDYSKLLVSYPKPKEQKKIAACLSAADALIEAQAQKIEQLQEHKKGLLQQLFPNING